MRLSALLDWLKTYKPHVVLLQEIKCETEKFPKESIEELGYNLAIHGQKGFNGVAILSLFPIDDFSTQLTRSPLPDHARYVEAIISIPKSAIRVGSIYVPNGDSLDSPKYQHKLEFFDAFNAYCAELLKRDEYIVIGGDFNVAPEEIDTFNPDASQGSVLFDLAVRKKFRSLSNLGMYNAFRLMHPSVQQFSWWDYRQGAWQRNLGMLIDHLLLSPSSADKLKSVEIHSNMRGLEKPSDHVPIMCELVL